TTHDGAICAGIRSKISKTASGRSTSTINAYPTFCGGVKNGYSPTRCTSNEAAELAFASAITNQRTAKCSTNASRNLLVRVLGTPNEEESATVGTQAPSPLGVYTQKLTSGQTESF